VESLARFLGSSLTIKVDLNAEDIDMEFRFRSLSLLDTRVGQNNVFREIMIPLNVSDDQFVLNYYIKWPKSEYICRIDQPKLILEIDYWLTVQGFFLAPFQQVQISTDFVPDNNFRSKISFTDTEIILLRNPEQMNSDAVVLMIEEFISENSMITVYSIHNMCTYFCAMDSRKETQLKFLHNIDVTSSLDRYQTAVKSRLNISVDTSKLIFRVSYQDLLLLNDIYIRLLANMNSGAQNDVAIATKSKKIEELVKCF
jgi:vacuolar protein sorting-associated protein 13A/C